MAVPSIDVNVLAKYCRDVNFDFQACLKAYLRQTLLAWEPEFEIKINPVTGDKGTIKNLITLLFKEILQHDYHCHCIS